MKLTLKKIDDFIKDEEKGAREYRKYGLVKLARDEAEHAKFLRGLKRCQKKEK